MAIIKQRKGERTQNKDKKKGALANKILAKKKTKVVNVRLAGKKKQASASGTKSASDSKKSASSKIGNVSKLRISKQKVAKTPQVRPDIEKKAPTVSPEYLAPTPKLLKQFREATKRSRKLAQQIEKESQSKRNFLAKPNKAGKKVCIDLRIHSPATEGYFSVGGVNPGAALVRLALAKKIDIIAVTDYYSAASIDEVRAASQGAPITVLPGIDLNCRIAGCNEVPFTALFPEHYAMAEIERVLLDLRISAELRGSRRHVLEQSIGEIIDIVERHGGVLIPSRLDKTPYRQLAITELVERYGFHAFDLVHPDNPEYFRRNWPRGEFTFFSFSNANALGQVGSRAMDVRINADGFAGILELVKRREGLPQ